MLDYSDSYWGAEVYVFIENLSSDIIAVQLRDTSVNGFMIDPLFSCDVLPGKRAHDSIVFLQSDMDDNSIDTINEMEFSLNIVDMESWDTIDLSEKITLKPD